MNLTVKKAIFPENLILERENYYNEMAKKGLTLIGIDKSRLKTDSVYNYINSSNYEEIFQKEKSEQKYKIVYDKKIKSNESTMDFEKNKDEFSESLITQGYHFVCKTHNQSVFSIETAESATFMKEIASNNNKRSIAGLIGLLLVTLSYILLLLVSFFTVSRNFLTYYIWNYSLVLYSSIIVAALPVLGIITFFISRLIKFKLHKLICFIYKKAKLLSLLVLIVVFCFSLLSSFCMKSSSMNYSPEFVLRIKDIEASAEIENNDMDTFQISFVDNYFTNERASYFSSEQISFDLEQKIYVFKTNEKAEKAFKKNLAFEKSKFSHSIIDFIDETDTEKNKGFDKIYCSYTDYLEYTFLNNYYILKNNIIIEYQLHIYGGTDEERASYKNIALEKLALKLSV